MTDIKELRRLAEAATPGEWEAISDTVEGVDCEFIAHILTSRFSATYDDKGEIAHIGNACDAEFIAAANPSAILSLLDKIDALTDALQMAKHIVNANGTQEQIDEIFEALESVGVKP